MTKNVGQRWHISSPLWHNVSLRHGFHQRRGKKTWRTLCSACWVQQRSQATPTHPRWTILFRNASSLSPTLRASFAVNFGRVRVVGFVTRDHLSEHPRPYFAANKGRAVTAWRQPPFKVARNTPRRQCRCGEMLLSARHTTSSSATLKHLVFSCTHPMFATSAKISVLVLHGKTARRLPQDTL